MTHRISFWTFHAEILHMNIRHTGKSVTCDKTTHEVTRLHERFLHLLGSPQQQRRALNLCCFQPLSSLQRRALNLCCFQPLSSLHGTCWTICCGVQKAAYSYLEVLLLCCTDQSPGRFALPLHQRWRNRAHGKCWYPYSVVSQYNWQDYFQKQWPNLGTK